ncbi:hypothetical protein RI367_006328 [Sorochytrium milnesiophthora]
MADPQAPFDFSNPPQYDLVSYVLLSGSFVLFLTGGLQSGMLCALLYRNKPRTGRGSSLLTINMLAANTAFCMFESALSLVKIPARAYSLGAQGCQAEGFILSTITYWALASTLFLASDRFLAIVMERTLSTRKWLRLIAASLLVALLISGVPLAAGLQFAVQPGGFYCEHDFSSRLPGDQAVSVLKILLHLLTVVLMLGMYAAIYYKVRTVRRQVKGVIMEAKRTPGATATIGKAAAAKVLAAAGAAGAVVAGATKDVKLRRAMAAAVAASNNKTGAAAAQPSTSALLNPTSPTGNAGVAGSQSSVAMPFPGSTPSLTTGSVPALSGSKVAAADGTGSTPNAATASGTSSGLNSATSKAKQQQHDQVERATFVRAVAICVVALCAWMPYIISLCLTASGAVSRPTLRAWDLASVAFVISRCHADIALVTLLDPVAKGALFKMLDHIKKLVGRSS